PYHGPHFDRLLLGELAAVTRDGSVYRINAEKLGGALNQLPAERPSVIEARIDFEIDREKTDALWAEQRAESAAAREALYDARQEAKIAPQARAPSQTAKEVGAVVRGLEKTAESIISGLASFIVGGPPPLTRQ